MMGFVSTNPSHATAHSRRRRARSPPPPPGGGTGTPSAAYSLSLLRNVRIEMPSTLAACVRLPRQCLSVSRMRSRSTSATVRPTSARDTCSAANAACATEEVPDVADRGGRRRGATTKLAPNSTPLVSSTARWMVFSSSRTSPGQRLTVSVRRASGDTVAPASCWPRRTSPMKYCASSSTSAGRSRSGGIFRSTTLSRNSEYPRGRYSAARPRPGCGSTWR